MSLDKLSIIAVSALLLALLLAITTHVTAQQPSSDKGKYPAPVTFTAQQDHDDMMKQPGIKTPRPGPSGDEKAPNLALRR